MTDDSPEISRLKLDAPMHASRLTERDARITGHVATGMGVLAGAWVALGAARLVPKCREPVIREGIDAAERLMLAGAAVAGLLTAGHVARTATATEEQARAFRPLLDELDRKADRGRAIA
jgi:hypothetical protein